MAAGPSRLRSEVFRRERQDSWRRLEALITRAERQGLEQLGPEELSQLSTLQRSAMSSLSVARAISLDRNLLEYLESLAARAYLCVYGTKRSLRAALAEFFCQRFPALVRELRWYVLLSAAFLALGTAVAFVQTLRDPSQYFTFVDAESAQGRDPHASTESLREVLFDGGDSLAAELGAFAGFLFDHNARVGITCFTLGFVFGLPVFWVLFHNGLMLGAMAALYHSRGLSLEFWSWILPHGVSELLATVLCGAAGLVVGHAVVLPGRHSRLGQLALQGRKAGTLVIGSVALLLLAALIEGLFRQLVQDLVVRYTVVALDLVLLGWYFLAAGRRRMS